MDTIAFIMKYWDIPEDDRDEVERIFEQTSPENIELALMMMGGQDEALV